jgi:hypothetical protein
MTDTDDLVGRSVGEAAFFEQAAACAALGSPFTAVLLEGLGADIAAGGACYKLVRARLDRAVGDALALRVAGALHAGALSNRDNALVAAFPNDKKPGDARAAVAAALSAFQKDRAWYDAFLAHPPRTNEVRRAIGLLPAFAAAGQGGEPLHLLELGASAGLMQHWDRFAYRARDWAWGQTTAEAPLIDTDWQGAAPVMPARIRIDSRAGCDLDPLDVREPAQRLRLKSFVWADQRDRHQRLDKAIALAIAHGRPPERADASDWLAKMLAGPLPRGVTIIYHTVAFQYFAPATRARVRAALDNAGAGADAQHRLIWLRMEHDNVFAEGDGFSVDQVSWPGRVHRRLGSIDPHGRWVKWG